MYYGNFRLLTVNIFRVALHENLLILIVCGTVFFQLAVCSARNPGLWIVFHTT